MSIINKMKGFLGKESEELEKLKALIDQFKVKEEEARLMMETLSKEKSAIILDIEKSTSKELELKKQINQLNSEIENYNHTVNQLQTKLADNQNELAALLNDSDKIIRSEKELKKEVESLKTEISSYKETISSLEYQLKDVKTEIPATPPQPNPEKEAELLKEIEVLKANLSQFKQEIIYLEEKQQSFTENQARAEDLNKPETVSSEEVEALKSEISQYKEMVNKMENQNRLLQNKSTSTEEATRKFVKELMVKVDLVNVDLKETKAKLLNYETETETLKTQNAELVNRLKNLTVKTEPAKPVPAVQNIVAEKPAVTNVADSQTSSVDKGFSGDINDVSLFDFLQMMVVSKKKRFIQVIDNAHDKVGKLFLIEGDVIHAEIDDLKGFDAFAAIISIRNGNFSVEPWVEPTEKTINYSSMNLFMEATRILDEQNAKLKHLEVAIGDSTESVETRNEISSQIKETLRADRDQINLLNRKLGAGGDPDVTSKIRKHLIQQKDNDKKETSRGINKILVVDDSATIVSLMKKYLSSQGFNVLTTTSARQAIDLLTLENYDLVITDINMPEINGIELFLWIRENRPEVQVIMMTAFGSDEIKAFASQKGALRYFEKPLNLKQIKDVIDELSKNKGLKGNLVDINIFDFVQMIVLSRKQKLILIKDPVTKQTGKLYLSYGDIIHAECGNLHGPDAFYSIMAMKIGSFSDEEWTDPEVKTINVTPMRLFLEATRKIDNEIIEMNDIEKAADMLNKESSTEVVAKQEVVNNEGRFIINEKGWALGITIGKTTKNEVITIMKEVSSTDYSTPDKFNKNMFFFEDISLIILFDDHITVKELSFGVSYPGSTSKGINIGDTVEKAVKAYGTPKFSSDKGVIWDKIAIFSKDSTNITTIRVS